MRAGEACSAIYAHALAIVVPRGARARRREASPRLMRALERSTTQLPPRPSAHASGRPLTPRNTPSHLAPSQADTTRTQPASGQNCPKSAEFYSTSVDIGSACAQIGRTRANFGRFLLPNLPENLAIFAQARSDPSPTSADSGPDLDGIGRHVPNFGRHRADGSNRAKHVVDLGQKTPTRSVSCVIKTQSTSVWSTGYGSD